MYKKQNYYRYNFLHADYMEIKLSRSPNHKFIIYY
jgi:hypothetical protein